MMIYVVTAHAVTDVEVDYHLYVGQSFFAAKAAAEKEISVNSNAQSVRIELWDTLSQKAELVKTIYQ